MIFLLSKITFLHFASTLSCAHSLNVPTHPNGDGHGVHAYIIDSGIRLSHYEFAGRAQWEFTASNIIEGNDDLNGHGTHLAGTVGSNGWGVAKAVNLHAVKVANSAGTATLAALIEGVNYVTNNHQSPAVAVLGFSSSHSQALNDADFYG